MTDIWAQLQLLFDQYWEQAVAVVFVLGAIMIVRLSKRRPAISPTQAEAQPGPHVAAQPDMRPSNEPEEYVDIVIRVTTRARILVPSLTRAEEAELRSAVAPSYEVLPPLPTTAPTQLPTKADTHVSTKAHDPTTPEENELLVKVLKLHGFGGDSQ